MESPTALQQGRRQRLHTARKDMCLKGVIFDLDGVLVDTVPLHFMAWQRMFTEYGYPFDEALYRDKVDGLPRQDGVRNIMTDADEATITCAGDLKQAYYVELIKQGHLQVFPSTIPFIKALREQNILLGAATSSVNARAILAEIGVLEHFAAVVTAADVSHGKPDPEIFTTAAQRLGLMPAECIVFEDARSGVEAAKRGGFFCIGVDRHSKPEYFTAADFVVSDLGSIDYPQLKRLLQCAAAV